MVKPLTGGSSCTIRPLEEADENIFADFILRVPEEERLFIKHRVTDKSIFHEWCTHIDYESNLPLLAIDDERVVADATLHQRSGGWKRHIGLASFLTLPEYHGKGLVALLAGEMVEIARHCGLTRLEVELNGERERAMHTLREAGFVELMRLRDYVTDMHGGAHDYVLFGMNLIPPDEYISGAD
ncbi:MAG: GNAT family N-acetyltransferase [Verrucomicrobiota bacterium]